MSEKKSINIWPESESACIWMEAGIVDFKLCDRQRDCEQCTFNAIMKNEQFYSRVQKNDNSHVDYSAQMNPLQRLKDLKWDGNAYYGSRYWYVEQLSRRKALIGLNELALQIFPTVKDIILAEEGKVKKDQIVSWLVTDNGTICLSAPFNADIEKTNPALLADMSERKNKVWLFTVESTELADELARLQQGVSAEFFMNEHREKIVTIFETEMQTLQATVGETMQDGCEIVSNLEQMIGPKRYFKIINDFLENCMT